ncbi:hypothetical protein K1W54_21505 [Micromonospora sp. CPCC 205371]|nr:hypothetical protein [Micromonospora sp. CPCC 205371]
MTGAEAQGTTPTSAALHAASALASRRTAFDTMMWQVPALALAAQAFLLTIALGSDIGRLSRVIAALLGLALAGMSIQLMAKYRYLEVLDSQLLERLEGALRLDHTLGFAPHAALSERARRSHSSASWLVRMSSYRLWLGGLALFGLADAVAAAAALVAI